MLIIWRSATVLAIVGSVLQRETLIGFAAGDVEDGLGRGAVGSLQPTYVIGVLTATKAT